MMAAPDTHAPTSGWSRSLPTREDFGRLAGLAVPIVTVQLGMMLMGVVDTIMVGHVNATALAAAALGNLYVFALLVFGMGTLMALDPIVAQAVGARDDAAVARGIQRGLVLSVLLTVPTSALFLPVHAFLGVLGQPADVVPLTARYVAVSIPGVLPFFAFVVLRQSLQAMGRMRPVVITIVLANLLNAALGWMFIFGKLGCPALGAVGAGLAATCGRWGMALGLLAIAWRELSPRLVPLRRESIALAPLGRMLRLGIPIGVQIQLEIGVFGVIALLMGRLGTVAMASHQVAINIASLTFMVPLGVGGAAAVLVGQSVGAGDAPRARRAAVAALGAGGAFMLLSGFMLFALPGLLARVYSSDTAVVALAMRLIPIAGVFQVFDGLQVVSVGVLRGVGDTRAPMVVNVLGFWLIGLPVSLWLGFGLGGGAVGLWWGLVAGLAAVAAFLVARVRARFARALVCVAIEEETVTA
ncbi:MAG: MATE family efflux transporter [Candidatus Eisenbacteria bacterium]|nr:MATE family efflux transporter [Candidatus Eisenbacteria bacterium]